MTVEKIRQAYHEGTLNVRTVDDEGGLCWRQIGAVKRFKNDQPMVAITTPRGSSRMTQDHRVYVTLESKEDASLLEEAWGVGRVEVEETQTDPFVYDLTVDNPSRYILANSGLLVSNSPDRNYKFRPPEQEGVVGRYNRVFGYIWEDYELLTYLEMSLNWFMSLPPSTLNIQTLDQLCAQQPGWSTWILWGAAVHALFAISANWVADEFSIAGESMLRVHVGGHGILHISIEDLHEIVKGTGEHHESP